MNLYVYLIGEESEDKSRYLTCYDALTPDQETTTRTTLVGEYSVSNEKRDDFRREVGTFNGKKDELVKRIDEILR